MQNGVRHAFVHGGHGDFVGITPSGFSLFSMKLRVRDELTFEKVDRGVSPAFKEVAIDVGLRF